MVQKRYQYFSREGVVWTKWFDYHKDDTLLKRFQSEEKYQLINSKLKNEFRVV